MSQIANSRELAARLGVNSKTVLRWAKQGLIPVMRPTKRTVLFDIPEVELALKGSGRKKKRD